MWTISQRWMQPKFNSRQPSTTPLFPLNAYYGDRLWHRWTFGYHVAVHLSGIFPYLLPCVCVWPRRHLSVRAWFVMRFAAAPHPASQRSGSFCSCCYRWLIVWLTGVNENPRCTAALMSRCTIAIQTIHFAVFSKYFDEWRQAHMVTSHADRLLSSHRRTAIVQIEGGSWIRLFVTNFRRAWIVSKKM